MHTHAVRSPYLSTTSSKCSGIVEVINGGYIVVSAPSKDALHDERGSITVIGP